MSKFYGRIGFAETVETKPGVWTEQLTDRTYFGDVLKSARHLDSGQQINDNISISNEVSILADPYAYDNMFAMRYIELYGSLWKISNVEVQTPRIRITLGGLYNDGRKSS